MHSKSLESTLRKKKTSIPDDRGPTVSSRKRMAGKEVSGRAIERAWGTAAQWGWVPEEGFTIELTLKMMDG